MEITCSAVQYSKDIDYVSENTLHDMLLKTAKTLADEGGVFLLVHAYDQVQIGIIKGATITLRNTVEPAYLQELRLFSQKGELHIWRTENTFSERLRMDKDEATGQEVLENFYEHEESHFMWGTDVEPEDKGWSLLTEDRGTAIWVPFDIKEVEAKTRLPLKYTVKNYIDFDEKTGMIKFVDARLCGFLDKKGKRL